MRAEKVMFGGISMYRVFCRSCDGYTLVAKGEKKCCGGSVDRPDSYFRRRESGEYQQRRYLSATAKREILDSQDNRCIYCEVQFGTYQFNRKKGVDVLARPAFDHFQPWAMVKSNAADNYVAACTSCNSTKSSKIFDNLEQAKLYILERRGLIGGSTVQAKPDEPQV